MLNLQKSKKFTEQKMYIETIRSFTKTTFHIKKMKSKLGWDDKYKKSI